MKKLSVLLISLFAAVVFCASAYAYDAVLNDVVLDYDKGNISLSGNIGEMNSGSHISIEIKDSLGNSIYADQITSTSKGKFSLNVKMNSSYKSGEYTVSIRGTNTDAPATKTFTFDASKDNFYVENVVIKNGEEDAKTVYDTDTLKVDFDFFSSFSYAMGDIDCKWQLAGSEDGTFYNIYESNNTEYALSLADIENVYEQHMDDFKDKKLYLRAVLKAKTENSQNYCAEVTSSNVVEIITTPSVSNVVISGTARVGKTLTGMYSYYDFQDKKEQNSDYEWLSSSSQSGTYKSVGKGISYIPSSADENRYLKLQITPKTENGSIAGKSVASAPVYVSPSSSSSSGGGGGGGGGGSSSGGGSTSAGRPVTPITTPAPSETPKPDDTDDTQTQDGFMDVDDSYWAKDDINTAVERGIVSGTGDGNFKPEESVTRAEFSKMILNTLKLDGQTYENEFSDVSSGDWYAEIVAACSKLGIVSGSDGMFRPNDVIKREEMAKMVILAYRTVEENDDFTSSEISFSDSSKISDWAIEFASECAYRGFITGMPDGTFAPSDNATRAQAAVVANRLYDSLYGNTDGED